MNQWQMHRAGLLNFWYYDQEEFFFADGKLLLRGMNGSGKSVTMQSLITVLLDGKIAASRLDPFGSKDRRMEDYLLGERELVEREERTGYLYLEYKRQDSEQYLTTGIGLKARRGGAIEFWGFVITDNRRIGFDFFLTKTEYNAEGRAERIPLTRAELEKLLVLPGGQVFRRQGDYAEAVNKYVFGFASQEQYKDLMELLIQLRSPKLSKEFRPSVIHEILTESLPALSEEELRPLSDTLENMKQTKEQLELLGRDREALRRLERAYDQYNTFILAEKAKGQRKAEATLGRQERLRQEQLQECEDKRTALEKVVATQASLESEAQALQREKEALEAHDVFQTEKRRQEVDGELQHKEGQWQSKNQAWEEKKKTELRDAERLRQERQRQDMAEEAMLEQLEELGEQAEAADFSEHEGQASLFIKAYAGEYVFASWKDAAEAHGRRLRDSNGQFARLGFAKERQLAAGAAVDAAQAAYDAAREAERQGERQFFTVREELLEALYAWVSASKDSLPMEAEEICVAAQSLQRVYETTRWQDVVLPAETARNRREDEWRRQRLATVHEAEQKRLQLREVELQLQDWHTRREPEPPRHEEKKAARAWLKEKNVPFLPFYEAVEFQEHVSAATRERIEAALWEMGLLDALLVPEDARKNLPASLADSVIQPEPAIMCVTLADYLQPLPPPEAAFELAAIDEALRSILVNDEQAETFLSLEGGAAPVVSARYGSYRTGILSGKAPQQESAVFIGRQARKEYRLQEIVRLEGEAALCREELAVFQRRLEGIEQELAALQSCWERFPREAVLDETYRRWLGQKQALAICENDAAAKNEMLRACMDETQGVLNGLRRLTEGLRLPFTAEAYHEAQLQFGLYNQRLQDLELARHKFIDARTHVRRLQEHVEEIQADVDALKGELFILTGEKERLTKELEGIEARLAALGAEDIRRRSREVVARLSELPGLLKQTMTEDASLRQRVTSLEQELERGSGRLLFWRQSAALWRRVFEQEAELRLLSAMEEEAVDWLNANQVWERYGPWVEQEEPTREKMTERLMASFFREQAVLGEYRLQMEEPRIEGLQLPQVPEQEEADIFVLANQELKQAAVRKLAALECAGRRTTPRGAWQELSRQIAEQQMTLTHQDRELYEEVIMNSIGRIISQRINSAESWVAHMNERMESLDTSSGLVFSLRWKPLTADDDSQMDTEDLVKLLRSDRRLLKDEDMKRIVLHFQSRIEQAKAQADVRSESFQDLVKETLDFRKWFSFGLFYRREGMAKKELTNSVFGKFSGGEKAMSMYIPLFSAAYSRYGEARPDAPKVISLDEAFAGVDENNIREMFALVEQLSFNYIMNSQALWGDYDTVRSLAICELIRPKNAPYVSVMRYHWDGRTRTLQGDEAMG